jgi:hypothetical protein
MCGEISATGIISWLLLQNKPHPNFESFIVLRSPAPAPRQIPPLISLHFSGSNIQSSANGSRPLKSYRYSEGYRSGLIAIQNEQVLAKRDARGILALQTDYRMPTSSI